MPSRIKTIAEEFWGLFVDDLALVLGALASVAAAAICAALGLPHLLSAAVLSLGLAASVLFSVWRRAGRKD